MSTLGMTKLNAVNHLLYAVGENPVSKLETGDASNAGMVEDFLDLIIENVEGHGWPENTEFSRAYTPAGTGAGGVAFTAGAWTALTRTLVKTACFPAGGQAIGSDIYIQSGTLTKSGYYTITTNADANTITLNHQIAIGNQTDIAAYGYGDLNVNVGDNVLWVRSAGPNMYRNLTVRGTLLYDVDRGTSKLESGATIYLDIIKFIDFEDLTPQLKRHIIGVARMLFQRWRLKSVTMDQFLAEEAIMESLQVDRHVANEKLQPPNRFPLLASVRGATERRNANSNA